MRVAVTGASGFIGGHIARYLAARGCNVQSLGRRPAAALASPVPSYTTWDVTAGPLELGDFDAVVHCAAHVGHWGAFEPYHAVNVHGLQNVIDTFPTAARFVHLSTASVYAVDQSHAGLAEDARTGEPLLTAYARTKAAAERLLLASGREAVVLRPHIVYGPGDTTLLPRLLASRRFGWLAVPGDGKNRVSVTHVLNLAVAVERALCGSVSSGVFNVSDGEDPTVDDLLRTALRRAGVVDRLVYIPRRVAWAAAAATELVRHLVTATSEPRLTRYVVANLADTYTLDITRARRRLQYEPVWNYRRGWNGGEC